MNKSKEQSQWLVILIIILGFAILGIIIMNQNSQINRVTTSLNKISSQVQGLEQKSLSEPELKPKTYTDSKSGISFIVPDGWTVGTDEGGNLDIIKGNPYSSIVFEKFTDKTAWQKIANTPIQSNDTLIKKSNITIGGFPTIWQVAQRDTGNGTSFQYAYYYVDGGNTWYVINTSDPSPEITQIMESVKF